MEIPDLTICDNKQGGKETRAQATITFCRGDILYDCATCAYVVGDIADDATMDHARHQIQDITDDGNIDRVTRTLGLAHAEVVEALFPFTKDNVDDMNLLDNAKDDPDEYKITLSLPRRFSKTTLRLLTQLIHEYMVCRVLDDWLGITYPKLAITWQEKAEATLQRIREAKAATTGFTRRALSPF